MTSPEQSWFVPLTEDTDRATQVFGMPQAGGGCATFADLADRTGSDIAFWGLNPPGRQARFAEPSVTDLDVLVARALDALRTCVDRPYVLFGYCSGALTAFLVARAAVEAGVAAPLALVVASYPAPHLAKPDPGLHRLPSERFWSEITTRGGLPAELAAQGEYREIFEEPLRADFEALAQFQHTAAPPLHVPIVAVFGRDDPLLTEPGVQAWAEHTSAGFRLERLDAGHWLLGDAPHEVSAILEEECRR